MRQAGKTAPRGAPHPRHPLEPLSKEEIGASVQLLQAFGKVTGKSRFPLLALNEPPKQEVLNYRPGQQFRREAFVIVYERDVNRTFEAVIDLKAKALRSWKEMPGVQPTLMLEDFNLLDRIVRADARWQDAMKKRGLAALDRLSICAWTAGDHGVAAQAGQRVLAASTYYRSGSRNVFARPIEGVIAFVNLSTQEVFKFVDTGVLPVPPARGDYAAEAITQFRKAPKPLTIAQPHGVTFEAQGQEVRWQNWHFRFGIHPREGLVLYTVKYEDQQKLRSIVYRASLSELFVPYGDPSPTWFFRNVYDMGETGLGWLTDPLEPNTDCPAKTTFFSARLANDQGVPYEIHRAVGLYERDGGLLWKHVDEEGNESRRARQLVLSSIATAGNYEYGFNWIFHQDGTLEMEVLLTGIMAAKGVADKHGGMGKESHGHLVAPNVEAVHHQHFFNFRLDLDIDGPGGNSVVEMNTEAMRIPDADLQDRSAMVVRETILRTEQEAQRQLSLTSARKWKVVNPTVKNALGHPVGYVLVTGENAVPYLPANSLVRKQAGFINAHLWVTPYDEQQMHAAGYYVGKHKQVDGLPQWTIADRNVENTDVVIWYTMGVTHIPRPEDWPVMPVHRAGFKLMPHGFFSRNPALDVPPLKKSP
jgi:primary-amine oxidase